MTEYRCNYYYYCPLFSEPAQSCLCESIIASHTTLPDDQCQFLSAVVCFEKGEKITPVVDNVHDILENGNYVFCNDEVTFYNPGAELNESGTEDDTDNVKLADVQVHVDSSYVQNEKGIDLSHTQTSNLFPEKTIDSDESALVKVISQGNNAL